MTASFGARLQEVVDASGRLCVGIDPHPGLLESWGLPDSPQGLREFGLRVVEAVSGRAGIVKPQIAFFERLGSAGYAALEEVLAAARSAQLLVIADVKRGDLDTSVDAYAEAWLDPRSELRADAITVVPYQGIGALAPVFERAARADAGVLVLGATSNPEAREVQAAVRADGRTVAAASVDGAREHGQGVVIGATLSLDDVGLSTERLVGLPILAPGYGAQGARIADAPTMFGDAAALVMASASRSILGAGPDGVAAAIAAHAQEARW